MANDGMRRDGCVRGGACTSAESCWGFRGRVRGRGPGVCQPRSAGRARGVLSGGRERCRADSTRHPVHARILRRGNISRPPFLDVEECWKSFELGDRGLPIPRGQVATVWLADPEPGVDAGTGSGKTRSKPRPVPAPVVNRTVAPAKASPPPPPAPPPLAPGDPPVPGRPGWNQLEMDLGPASQPDPGGEHR